MEFRYGSRKSEGEKGGYHVDPTPLIFVFYDDLNHYVEGVNTNYLPTNYLMKLIAIVNRFPGLRTLVGGKLLYKVVKRTAPQALELGYRKYIRNVIREVVYHETYDNKGNVRVRY